MRLTLLAILFFLPATAFAGDTLQTCYSLGSNQQAVTECLDRYRNVAEGHMSQVYSLSVGRAAAIDNAQQNNSKDEVKKLEAAQESWQRSTDQTCEMHRLSGGTAGDTFKAACLAEAYQARTEALRGIR